MPRLQTGGGRTQESRKERGCTEAEKAKGKEMTEALKDAPDQVKHSEMRRDWWIYYRWGNVTAIMDYEPVYIKIGIRPFWETLEAATQFDQSFRNNPLRLK